MNSEHYGIVIKGTKYLNKWRETVLNQHVQLDLSESDLSNLNLDNAKDLPSKMISS